MSWTHTRSQIAVAKKKNPDADVSELRTQLKTELLADYVKRTVATMPPLTDEQVNELVMLLRGGEQ